jgi:uncharacterized protein (TIGR02266 family)
MLTKDLIKETLQEPSRVQRKYDRVPKKFKVTYSSPRAFTNSYLSDIGRGGLFIRTKNSLELRDRVNLRIDLPDDGEELKVLGEVVWSREKNELTPVGKHPQGIGIKFLNLSPFARERIDRVLYQASN